MPIINQIVKGGGTTPTGLYREFQLDANGKLVPNATTTHIMDFTGVKSVGAYMLYQAYYNNDEISGVVNLSSIETLTDGNSMQNCFSVCGGITGADFSNLREANAARVIGSTFSGCSNFTTIDLSSLLVVGSYSMDSTFSSSGLTTLKLYSLKRIAAASAMYRCCAFCSALTSVYFYALDSSSFGTATNQFSGMLTSVTGCTVHFPSNIQSTIGSWSDVTSGFGGTNTTVLFDLPSTAHLIGVDTVEYERNPKYDTATALAWRVKDTGTAGSPVVDWTPFYTSGLTDPTVGATIYSDSACTTAVTTVSAIA